MVLFLLFAHGNPHIMDKDVQDVWLQSNGKIEEGIISDAGGRGGE